MTIPETPAPIALHTEKPRALVWWWVSPLAAFVFALGLLLAHHEMFGSGFGHTPGDLSDAVLVHYSMEHDYLWMMRQTPHTSYWNTPMFYPQKGVTANTDSMLGMLPFYAPLRWLGLEPGTAFQMWLLLVCGLNFVSFYWLLGAVFGYSDMASVAGAYLFAFASPRIIQEWHPQLVPCFYMTASIAGVYFVFSRRRVPTGWSLFFGGFLAQLYTAYYYAWFLAFGCLAALIWALVRHTRRVADVIYEDRKLVLTIGAIAACGCIPFVVRSLSVAHELGVFPYQSVRALLPGITSWIKQGSWSWCYGWLDGRLGAFQTPGFWEESNGIGFITAGLVLCGLWWARKRPAVRTMCVVAMAFVILSFRLPNGWSLWRFVYVLVPGAGGVRAVGRVGLMLLFPACIGLASTFERISLSTPIAAIAALVVVLEQGGNPITYDKLMFRDLVGNLATHVPLDCPSFLFSPGLTWTPAMAQTVAIWAVNRTGVPTLNGFSGVYPRDWSLDDSRIRTESDRLNLRAKLTKWQSSHPALSSICWISLSDSGDYQTERIISPPH